MSVQRRGKAWVVRWKEGKRHRQRTFDRAEHARLFDGELRRRRQLGTLALLDRGTETLDTYVSETWAPTYLRLLSPKTWKTYTSLYDSHLSPGLGDVALRAITPK
ncbi:MAG: hypothetical protein JO321_14460 [Solirubrobacterales bacterium]|nr:hypothetical protein [Solirubrobacterales bacterium]MBV9166772.1 hypothetical protein [Solirubrobacterales bacterium]MBV9536603.1 hypothetical protein [Solirubrobacterales bacterium]